MLQHHHSSPQPPERAVVLGAGGFVGSAIARKLEAAGAETARLTRPDVDLQSEGAAETLAGLLREGDALVCVSAIAPVKNIAMLKDNLSLIETMGEALRQRPVAHVVNIGSDAIYADSADPLNEQSCAAPGSLHGVMHLTRELVLGEAAGDTPFATLRPTLIYGADDPHNGYGPNRFRRLAEKGEDIVLFGNGEERRDHVWVEDVAELTCRMVLHRSEGALNAATGTVVSFHDCAQLVRTLHGLDVEIKSTPRSGPMPHNGYRPFDASATKAAFADFSYTLPDAGFAKVRDQLAGA